MRLYTQQHPFYWGIAWHARPMSLCIMHRDGESLVHHHRPAGPAPFLKAIAPSRADVVVCVAGLFPWYWRADLCARAGLPFVLGPALSMPAIQGGNATNDPIEAQQMAGRLRGGLLPQASVSPAAMRAPRARLRRRVHLTRTRAELLAPLHHTHSPYTLPEMGQKSAATANRGGVAARLPDPAVPTSVAGDLALMDCYAQ